MYRLCRCGNLANWNDQPKEFLTFWCPMPWFEDSKIIPSNLWWPTGDLSITWAMLVAFEEMDDIEEKVMPTEPEPKSELPSLQKSDAPEMKVFSASWLEVSWVCYSSRKGFAGLWLLSCFDRLQVCQSCKTTSPPHWTCNNSKAPRRSGRH